MQPTEGDMESVQGAKEVGQTVGVDVRDLIIRHNETLSSLLMLQTELGDALPLDMVGNGEPLHERLQNKESIRQRGEDNILARQVSGRIHDEIGAEDTAIKGKKLPSVGVRIDGAGLAINKQERNGVRSMVTKGDRLVL